MHNFVEELARSLGTVERADGR
ncbi:hypothetical protein SGPA1_50865 [Streptomyces misionensis JCM 4497]